MTALRLLGRGSSAHDAHFGITHDTEIYREDKLREAAWSFVQRYYGCESWFHRFLTPEEYVAERQTMDIAVPGPDVTLWVQRGKAEPELFGYIVA